MAQVTTVEATENLSVLARDLATQGLDQSRDTWLSMYVDLNTIDFATTAARAVAVASAFDEALRAAPDEQWTAMLEELRERFVEHHEEIAGAHGLFVYSCDPAEATVVKLPCCVEQQVAFASSAHVRPLVEALPGDRWCVLLINRRTTRILLGDAAGFEELSRYSDDVEGQHSRGGMAQARMERNIEEQALRHIRDTVQTIELLRHAGMWQHLLVAAPDELHSSILDALPAPSRREFVSWFSSDIEHASVGTVSELAQSCVAAYEHKGVVQLLEILRQNAGQNGRATLGLDATMRALNEQRVETLLVNEGFRRPGAICDFGDWLAPGSSACPVHGRRMRPAADVIEAAIEVAVRAGTKVVTVPRHEDGDLGLDSREFQQLESLGNIASITRFELEETAVPEAWD